MAVTTTTQLTKPVNVMFLRRFLERAKNKTQYFLGTDAAKLEKHGGTATALWRRIEHLTPTTTPLSELTAESYPTRTGVTPSVTDITKAVSKYGTHILLNEEADVFNFNGTTAELMDVLAEHAGRSCNMVIRNEMEDNATLVYANGSCDGEINSIVSLDKLKAVINTLNRNVAESFTAMTSGSTNIGTSPILAGYYGVCHPDVAMDITALTGFKSIETYAGQVKVLPGEFGFLGLGGYGIRFMQTPDASIDADSGASVGATIRSTSGVNADLYTIVVYGRHAVGTLGLGTVLPETVMDADGKPGFIEIINKPFGSAGSSDPLNECSTMAWKAWCAGKILNSNWIRGIRCASTKLA